MRRKSAKAEAVFEFIRGQIKAQYWKVGERIPSESKLCEMLSVSRSTLRDALAQFNALGILKSCKGRGTYVIDDNIDSLTGTVGVKSAAPPPEQVRDVLEFRLLIEPECVRKIFRLSAEKRRRLILELEKCNEAMEQNVGRAPAFIAADVAFHILIAEASGNQFIGDCVHLLFERTLTQHKQINSLFGFQDGLRCHRRILEGIKSSDEGRAVREMHAHIKQALDALEDKN